jgi:peptide/nickel transport system substrate-binding protein
MHRPSIGMKAIRPVYALVAVVMILAAGCSGTSTPKASPTGPHGSLTVALAEAPVSLDPQGTDSAQDSTIAIAKQVFDTLVTSNAPGSFQPSLATSWSQPSATQWVFHLRTNARFTNGQPVTANDVVASLNRIVAQKGPISALWASLSSVQAQGPHAVVINTTQPLGTLLDNLEFLFVAPASLIGGSSYWSDPIGSGPFKVASFVPDQSATLVANPSYWGGPPRLQTLKFVYIPNAADLAAALSSGQVQVALKLDPSQAPTLENTPGLTIDTFPSYSYYFIWFNESRAPFTDPRVRQAMWYALPMQQIVSSIYGKYASVATAPIPSSVFGYKAEPPYSYDPTKAKQLLAEAGFPNGFTTSMMWQTNQAPFLNELAQAFRSAWLKVGINVQLSEQDPATWLKNLLALNWNMDFQQNTVLTGDADFALGRLYLCSAHRMGYCNSQLDGYLLGARTTTNQARRKALYGQAIDLIWSQAVGIYPLQVNLTMGWSSSVKGLSPVPSDLPYFKDVSIG